MRDEKQCPWRQVGLGFIFRFHTFRAVVSTGPELLTQYPRLHRQSVDARFRRNISPASPLPVRPSRVAIAQSRLCRVPRVRSHWLPIFRLHRKLLSWDYRAEFRSQPPVVHLRPCRIARAPFPAGNMLRSTHLPGRLREVLMQPAGQSGNAQQRKKSSPGCFLTRGSTARLLAPRQTAQRTIRREQYFHVTFFDHVPLHVYRQHRQQLLKNVGQLACLSIP